MPAFDNKYSVDQYVQSINRNNNTPYIKASTDSNYVYLINDYNSPQGSYTYKITFSWKNGWLQDIHLKQTLLNTLIYDLEVKNLIY